MALNAFIVRPFGKKELIVNNSTLIERLKKHQNINDTNNLYELSQIGETNTWKVNVDFDKVHDLLIMPALEPMRIRGETAGAIVVAGNIREDMFNRLITDDLVIADLSMNNANVFYELGIRQAFRDKYTFLIRSNLSEYPFDLKTDRYFEYDLVDLIKDCKNTVKDLTKAIRLTVMSNKPDSPVFKLLPKLEAEDRSRFISVPDEFREEVMRARFLRLPEHLSILAIECADSLWEAEGLREVGRAQFEANFIDDAKVTWEMIVNRYPDDIEANTTLSTIYQRRNEATRSEQALARVSRLGGLTSNRLSQLRSLNGRNLKEAWIKQWQSGPPDGWQAAALSSPLLQRAYEAYEESFKADLNNAYAGLNALTLLVIQTELSNKLSEVWLSIQRSPNDSETEQTKRRERIGQLIATLELAVESERDRLRRETTIDPWFNLLSASVECIVSKQPEYVAQLFADARHFAPMDSEDSMRRALKIYQDLNIKGFNSQSNRPGGQDYKTEGAIGENVKRALKVLSCSDIKKTGSSAPKRILIFAGLRLPLPPKSEKKEGVSRKCIEEIKTKLKNAILSETGQCDNGTGGFNEVVFGIAAGAYGGDLLFHEVCHAMKLPTRLCLALPRAEYIGRYVTDAGSDWVDRFYKIYRDVDEMRRQSEEKNENTFQPWAIKCFTDSSELPRWLQGRPDYDVGRRNRLWMLQHAIVLANQLGESTEVTLITLFDGKSASGIGSIGHMIERAGMAGIKVKTIELDDWSDYKLPPEPIEIEMNAIIDADNLSAASKSVANSETENRKKPIRSNHQPEGRTSIGGSGP